MHSWHVVYSTRPHMRVDYNNKQYDTHRWPIKEEKQELNIVETGSGLIK